MKHYIFLGLAVVLGLVGSTMLNMSAGFTVLMPTMLCLTSYLAAFYFFSLALAVIPLSIGYAVWAGLSTALNAVIGLLVFGEIITSTKAVALTLVIVGIVLINQAKKPASSPDTLH